MRPNEVDNASDSRRFRVIASYLSKVTNFNLPHLHLAPPLGVTPLEFCRDLRQLAMPRLDYGNATLAGLPTSQLRRLQSVLNAAARLTMHHRSSRYEHVTPMLRDLHWLRSPERTDFKLAVLVYRCLHGLAPRCLSDRIQLVADSNRRRLRSSSSLQLVIRRTRLSTVGDAIVPFRWPDAAFGTVCHRTSRQLQRSLFLFRNCLKTHLFSRSFP